MDAVDCPAGRHWWSLLPYFHDIYIDIGDYSGVVIADCVVDTKALIINDNDNFSVTLDWVSIALNLIVNIMATLLIAHRAWWALGTSFTSRILITYVILGHIIK